MIQRNLGMLEEGDNKNLMKFSRAKCKVLHLGQQIGKMYFCRKALGALVDNKSNLSQLCVLVSRKVSNLLLSQQESSQQAEEGDCSPSLW